METSSGRQHMRWDWRDAHYANELNRIVLALYAIPGAIKIDTVGGFGMKMHRGGSLSPPSPIYFNLRTEINPKPGPLTEEVIEGMAQAMVQHLTLGSIDFEVIAGIPNAGDPFARALQVILQNKRGRIFPFIPLKKDGETISIDNSIRGRRRRALLVDDVLTSGISASGAVGPLRGMGFKVTDYAAFLNREQGGRELLGAMGVATHTPLTVRSVVEIGYQHDLITSEIKGILLAYFEKFCTSASI